MIQAICIDAEAQHYRRMISTDGIFTRGTLYWQLVHIQLLVLITHCMSLPYKLPLFLTQNDIWQAQSWASLEWSGQWKLLHHFMRRTYDHVLVSPFYLNGRISIYVVVDVAHYDISYDFQVNIISWSSVLQ